MLIFDNGYMELRNKYILPLSQYSIGYRNLKNNNVKELIKNKIIKVQKDGDRKYVLFFEEELLMKALLGDIQLLFIRFILQKNDVETVWENRVKISENWNIVTNYYYAYYTSSLLLRLCFRGNMFLDKELKSCVETVISSEIGEIISLDSNVMYEIQKREEEFVLILSPGMANTHELVWKEIDKLLDEVLLLTIQNSDEYTVIKLLKNINNKLGTTFPSQLRNRVNYQLLYSVAGLEKNIYPIKISEEMSWLKEILSFDSKEVCASDARIANVFVAYGVYIKILASKLINEYYDIRGTENGILKNINSNREDKIEFQEYPFTFDV